MNLYKEGKEERDPKPVASILQNSNYMNTVVKALKMFLIYNENRTATFFLAILDCLVMQQ